MASSSTTRSMRATGEAMEWIDFAEIRAKVSLEDVLLTMYGLGDTLKRQGRRLVGPCPIHHGDSPRAFQADLEKNVYFCFSGCRKGGNVIDFVVAMEKLPVRDAALRLHARFLGAPSAGAPAKASEATAPTCAPPAPLAVPSPPAAAVAAEDAPAASNPPLTVRLSLDPTHPHLVKERGLSKATLDAFGVGYCARGTLRGTIAIAVRDEDGDVVAYAARRLKAADIREHGKYKLPKGFRRDLVLYNLDRARAAPREEGLVLVEGFFAAMTLFGRGVPNAVASMGASLSEAQADLLAEYADHVTVLFDGDDAGRGGAEEARARLTQRGITCSVIALPSGWSPEDVPKRMLRWALQGVRLLGLRDLAFAPQGESGAVPPESTP